MDYFNYLVPHQTHDGVHFDVFVYGDQYDFDEKNGNYRLTFSINSNGEVSFHQSELIEPNEILSLGKVVISALKEAKEFIVAPNWNLDQIPNSYNSSTNVRLKSDDGENGPDALGINFSIMENNTVIQTGEVDWQKGVYVWNSEHKNSPQHITAFFEEIHKVVYSVRDSLVEHQCLNWN
jgi:hypothetical protein